MTKTRFAPVAILLMASGACALIYQVTWLRELRLVFGSTTAASAAVVAIFMGGLGIGNTLLGKRADSSANPLALYALLEGFIALTAGISPWLIDVIRGIYIQLGGQMALGAFGATAVRLALTAVILLIPTVLMGGTLPAAAAAATVRDDKNRLAVALFYGLNTVGAVAGAMASTFLMLPMLGTRLTLWIACFLNIGVSACAWILSRRPSTAPVPAAPQARRVAKHKSPQQRTPPVEDLDDLPHRFHVYTAAGVVGFAFMLMELVWYRILAPILGGTTYTFGLILSVALLGIGLGGALYPVFFRRRRPSLLSLSLTCGLEALCLVIPFALGDRLAIAVAVLHEANHYGFAMEVLGWTAIATIVILPAAIVSGVQFPVLIALLGRGDKDIGSQVGRTYAFNTVGSIVGSLAGGFGLIPLLSAIGAWRLVAIVLAGLCAYLALVAWRQQGKRLGSLVTMGVGVSALSLLAFPGPTAVWRHSGIGAGRTQLPNPRTANAMTQWANVRRNAVIWQADGVEAGVAIEGGIGLSFVVNGKNDGNSLVDVGTQTGSGLLAAALHPDPKSCFVIGLGTGETAGWLGKIPSVERVDVVEIEPTLDEMVRRCAPVNGDVLNNPKVQIVYNDAREVLLTNRQKYDVIASEPSNPYRAGIASLYTKEYYEAVSARLNEGGLLIQWLQSYDIDEATALTVFATLKRVFPHVEVWQSRPGDMLLLCSNEPFSYTSERIRSRMAEEPYRTALAFAWRATGIEGFLARYLVGEPFVDAASQDFANCLNTDDHNRIEYGFARTLGKSGGFSGANFRDRAVALNADRPSGDFADVDWEGVEDEKIAMYVVCDQAAPDYGELSKNQAARREAMQRYLARDFSGMISAWESQPREASYPSETALLALAYATKGNIKAKALAKQLRSFNPREADMISGILLAGQGKNREASRMLATAFVGLRKDPWPIVGLARHALAAATELARNDSHCARELLEALKEPFLVDYADDDRRWTACSIATRISPQVALPWIESYEPHIPWELSFLTLRDRVYAITRHALAAQAQADLACFLQNESSLSTTP